MASSSEVQNHTPHERKERNERILGLDAVGLSVRDVLSV
jgi:hypothetical protein